MSTSSPTQMDQEMKRLCGKILAGDISLETQAALSTLQFARREALCKLKPLPKKCPRPAHNRSRN